MNFMDVKKKKNVIRKTICVPYRTDCGFNKLFGKKMPAIHARLIRFYFHKYIDFSSKITGII